MFDGSLSSLGVMGERREIVERKRAEILAAVHAHRDWSVDVVSLGGLTDRDDHIRRESVRL